MKYNIEFSRVIFLKLNPTITKVTLPETYTNMKWVFSSHEMSSLIETCTYFEPYLRKIHPDRQVGVIELYPVLLVLITTRDE